jgi:hypothetical protein
MFSETTGTIYSSAIGTLHGLESSGQAVLDAHHQTETTLEELLVFAEHRRNKSHPNKKLAKSKNKRKSSMTDEHSDILTIFAEYENADEDSNSMEEGILHNVLGRRTVSYRVK